jgi:hypothetical protein
MVRTTIVLGAESGLVGEPMALDGGRVLAWLEIREDYGGSATILGDPAQMRELAAAATNAAEQAEEMLRVGELLADAGLAERGAA